MNWHFWNWNRKKKHCDTFYIHTFISFIILYLDTFTVCTVSKWSRINLKVDLLILQTSLHFKTERRVDWLNVWMYWSHMFDGSTINISKVLNLLNQYLVCVFPPKNKININRPNTVQYAKTRITVKINNIDSNLCFSNIWSELLRYPKGNRSMFSRFIDCEPKAAYPQ